MECFVFDQCGLRNMPKVDSMAFGVRSSSYLILGRKEIKVLNFANKSFVMFNSELRGRIGSQKIQINHLNKHIPIYYSPSISNT